MMKRGRNIFRYVATALCLGTLSVAAIPPGGGGGDGGGGGGPGWIAYYSVSSANAKVGKPVYLNWQTYYTVGCQVWTNQTGVKSVPTSGSTTVTPTSASTMSVRLTCAGTSGQTTSQTRSFSVNQADHPELNSFSANVDSTFAGSAVTLSWSSEYSDYCKLSGAATDTLGANGSRTVYPAQGNNVYFLECRANDGRVSNKLSESVVGTSPYPSIGSFYIVAPPNSSNYQVTWFSNAEYCVLDYFTVSATGARTYPKPGYPVTHNLTCYRNGYSTSKSTTYYPPANGGGDQIFIEGSDGDGNQY